MRWWRKGFFGHSMYPQGLQVFCQNHYQIMRYIALSKPSANVAPLWSPNILKTYSLIRSEVTLSSRNFLLMFSLQCVKQLRWIAFLHCCRNTSINTISLSVPNTHYYVWQTSCCLTRRNWIVAWIGIMVV